MTEIRAKHISYINKYKWVLTHENTIRLNHKAKFKLTQKG